MITGTKSTMAMFLACDPWAKGARSERSTLYAYDGDLAPELFDANDPEFRDYGVMEITASKPIEKLPFEDSESGGRRVFNYDLQIEIVGGSVQIIATDPADDGNEVGKMILPELDKM